MNATNVVQVIDVDTYSVVVSLDASRTSIEPDGTISITLTPLEAGILEQDVYEACEIPTQCVLCEAYSVALVQGSELCHAHAKAYDQVHEVAK